MGSVASFAASLAVRTEAVVPKGTTAEGRGLLLYKEGGEGDGLMAAGREPHHFTHIGADMRFPGEVGPFIVIIDVTHRAGQRVLLWIPIVVWKPLVREPFSVVLRQESQEVSLLPPSDVHQDLRAARASSKKGGTETPQPREA